MFLEGTLAAVVREKLCIGLYDIVYTRCGKTSKHEPPMCDMISTLLCQNMLNLWKDNNTTYSLKAL